MPRTRKTAPTPSREKGQKSLDPEEMFLWKLVPSWIRPIWYEASFWRSFVLMQPVAIDSREAIISMLTALDWKIEPRDSEKRDELKEEIDYYTRLFENGGEYDWTELLEWLCTDYLDIPFGAGLEIGREGNVPEGKVRWLLPLDGGTLFPSLNDDYPVGQSLPENLQNTVYFPWYNINRIYTSPRTQINRKGWGMPPPEKIYLALEMLNRGDKYYAQLLLDTPEAGILDLIDMDKESASEWISSFKSLMTGVDAFKVPVLYEHDKEAKFIPFGRPPTEILYGQVTAKYAALACSAYGISPSDINFPSMGNGGETLAGSIRQERQTRRTGISRAKKKLRYFFDRILPPYLRHSWIDLDDELSVALGRARLASATAMGTLIDKREITPKEARLQLIADGLFTISMPEDVDESGFDIIADTAQNPFGNTANGSDAKRPGMLGTQVPPSIGGQGEIKKSKFEDEIDLGIDRMVEALENKTTEFAFLPDINSIADEWTYLVPEAESEELRSKLAEYVKNVVPERFCAAYSSALPNLELEDMDVIYDNISKEISELRYNLVDDFSKEVIRIAKGNKNGATKKTTTTRRSNRKNE